MAVEHVFSDGNWALAVAAAFSLLACSVLGRMLVKRSKLPAWQLVLSVLALGVSATLAGLAWHDCATKIARVRLEQDPARITIARRFPKRTVTYGEGELLAIGITKFSGVTTTK